MLPYYKQVISEIYEILETWQPGGDKKKNQFYSTEHKNVQKTSNSLNTWRISTAYDWKTVKRSFGKSVIQYVEVIHFSTRGCWLWDRDKNMEIGSLRQPKIRSLLWWAQEWACHCNRHPRENSIRIVPFSKSQKLKITPVSGVFFATAAAEQIRQK